MKRTLDGPNVTRPGAAPLLERHVTDDAEQRRWSSRAALLVPSAAVGMVVASVLIVVLAQRRGRADEVVAGVTLAFFAVAFLAWGVSRRQPALAALASLGVLVQVAATFYYYYSGMARDANAYHNVALTVLDPAAEIPGRFGLDRSEWANWVMVQLVAAIYRVTGPSQLAAFFVFAAVGFSAKVVFAHTILRLRALLGRWSVPAVAAAMLMPSLALWLAPISKEALAVLGISLVLAGIARPPDRNPSATLILIGIGIAATTRPQISLLLAGCVVAYAARLVSAGIHSAARRFAFLTASLVFVVGAAAAAASFLDVDLTLESFASARDDTGRIGPRGGSGIEPRPIRGPGDVPVAASNVLLRPHLGEAETATMLAQAAESTAIALAFAIVLLRANGRRRHRVYGPDARLVRALRFYCLVYTAGFVYIFSGAYNLGLLSRQRSQLSLVLILLLVLMLIRARSSREVATAPLASAGHDSVPDGSSTSSHGPGVRASG